LLSFAITARSAAAPERVFAVVADAARWREWAGPLIWRSSWEREGDPPPGGVGAIRRLGSSRIYSREEVVSYQPPYRLGYVILSGQPVRGYRADIELAADGSGTLIQWRASFEPKVAALGPLIRWYLAVIVGGFARRLARRAAED